jgi:hypothetical protein
MLTTIMMMMMMMIFSYTVPNKQQSPDALIINISVNFVWEYQHKKHSDTVYRQSSGCF